MNKTDLIRISLCKPLVSLFGWNPLKSKAMGGRSQVAHHPQRPGLRRSPCARSKQVTTGSSEVHTAGHDRNGDDSPAWGGRMKQTGKCHSGCPRFGKDNLNGKVLTLETKYRWGSGLSLAQPEDWIWRDHLQHSDGVPEQHPRRWQWRCETVYLLLAPAFRRERDAGLLGRNHQ